MRIAVVQHDIVWEDAPATIERLEPQVAQAAATGARLVMVTEMFGPGFSMDTERVAESDDGPSTRFLVEAARRHQVWMCGSIPMAGTDRAANVCHLVAPDGTIHRYAKIHPFSYSGEDEYYRAGTELVTVEVEGLRVSLFVCFDVRFATEWWTLAPHTDCYLIPANFPAARRTHWTSLLTARAIENQAYVVGANRVGTSGTGLEYCGDSMIIDPMGEVLASAAGTEAIIVAEVDPERVRAVREHYRFLPDRLDWAPPPGLSHRRG